MVDETSGDSSENKNLDVRRVAANDFRMISTSLARGQVNVEIHLERKAGIIFSELNYGSSFQRSRRLRAVI